MIAQRMPADVRALAERCYSPLMQRKPVRLLATEHGDFVPSCGATLKIGQDLRPAQRVRQAVIADVEDPGDGRVRMRLTRSFAASKQKANSKLMRLTMQRYL